MKQDTEKRITVEDLLRLKRAERPPPEFWARFESEIRSKQLSAIVNKRPWWQGISAVIGFVNRHQLPFGAAAALALALAGIHYAASPSQLARSAEVKPEGKALAAAPVESVPAQLAPVALREAGPQREVEIEDRAASAPRSEGVAVTASHLTKAPTDIPVDAASKSPFADGIAVTLADYRQAAPEYTGQSVFSTDREFEPSVAPVHAAPSEPLARMDPAEERRARLLAPALAAYSSGPRDWMKERVSSDERMYESIDRGTSDRMLVGFRF